MKTEKCMDCGKNTFKDPVDYYMLKDKVWLSINPKDLGMLCMDCCEKRLGRKIVKADILPCVLTEEHNPYTRNILSRGNSPIAQ